jgi:hypothetical protein
MPALNRQPLNVLAPFRVQSPQDSFDDSMTTPVAYVGEVVLADGSSMSTASGGSLPTDIDAGTF